LSRQLGYLVSTYLMKRLCRSNSGDPTKPSKKPNSGSLASAAISGVTTINRDVEVAKSYIDFPREIYWRIFSNCSEDNYKPLLKFNCVSQGWNKLIQEYILHWRDFEKRSLDHYAALCENSGNLEDDLSLAPRGLYNNKLAQIYTWNGTRIFEILSSELEAFNKKEINKEGISNVNIFDDQFRLIKISECYLFSDQLFFDIDNEDSEEDLDFESIFKFLASVKSSNTVKALMTRLVQHINDMFTKNTDSQGILMWLMFNLVRRKLVDFNQIKPFILHITSLLDSANDELSNEIMKLFDMCIRALSDEVVPFLNKEKAYKNLLIEKLLTQIIPGSGTKNSALELLRNMQQYHCLQSEQQEIIIKYLDKQNWKIDILLLVRLGDEATLLKALHTKISSQFVNNIYEGLVKIDLDSKTIHEDFFISSGILIHTMRFLQHTFQLLLQDRSINENVRNELKRVVELLWKIEKQLNTNPEYAMKEENFDEGSGSEVSDTEVTDSETDDAEVDDE